MKYLNELGIWDHDGLQPPETEDGIFEKSNFNPYCRVLCLLLIIMSNKGFGRGLLYKLGIVLFILL